MNEYLIGSALIIIGIIGLIIMLPIILHGPYAPDPKNWRREEDD